jgi:hypothetical protein
LDTLVGQARFTNFRLSNPIHQYTPINAPNQWTNWTKNAETPPEIADWAREAIRLKHYSMHSEAACLTRLKPHRHEQLRTPWSSAQGVLKSVPQIC